MAARGVETITEGGGRLPVIDRHRDEIAEALRAKGPIVSTDVGLSDFGADIVIADPTTQNDPWSRSCSTERHGSSGRPWPTVTDFPSMCWPT